jgi:hypothetical protein
LVALGFLIFIQVLPLYLFLNLLSLIQVFFVFIRALRGFGLLRTWVAEVVLVQLVHGVGIVSEIRERRQVE